MHQQLPFCINIVLSARQSFFSAKQISCPCAFASSKHPAPTVLLLSFCFWIQSSQKLFPRSDCADCLIWINAKILTLSLQEFSFFSNFGKCVNVLQGYLPSFWLGPFLAIILNQVYRGVLSSPLLVLSIKIALLKPVAISRCVGDIKFFFFKSQVENTTFGCGLTAHSLTFLPFQAFDLLVKWIAYDLGLGLLKRSLFSFLLLFCKTFLLSHKFLFRDRSWPASLTFLWHSRRPPCRPLCRTVAILNLSLLPIHF